MIISLCSGGIALADSEGGNTISGDNTVVVVEKISITADSAPVGTSIVRLYAGDTKDFDVEAAYSNGITYSDYRDKVKWQWTIGSVSDSGKFTSSKTGILLSAHLKTFKIEFILNQFIEVGLLKLIILLQ